VAAATKEPDALVTVADVAVGVVPEGNSTVTVTCSIELARDAVCGAEARAGYGLVDRL
jgi:copper chaperone